MDAPLNKSMRFRVLKSLLLFVSVFVGTEVALWLWELTKSQTKSVEQSSQHLILALGDSVSQMGYAQILENTRGGAYRVQNLALAGSGMSTVLRIFTENTDTLINHAHEVVVMTGHNDCQYLRHFAQLHAPSVDEPWWFEIQRVLWGFRTVRFAKMMWTVTQKSQDNSNKNIQSARNIERCVSILRAGYSELALKAQQHGLSLHFMTYPIPHRISKENWTDLMWVSLFINQEVRLRASELNIPLIDGEKCMAELPVDYWKSDRLHLDRAGALAQMECVFNHLGIEP